MRRGFSHCGTSALFRKEMQHAELLACLGVSIALHAAALFALPGLRPIANAGSSSAMTVTFASTPVPPQAEVAVTHRPSRSRRETNPDPPVLAISGPVGLDVAQPAQTIPAPALDSEIAGAASLRTDAPGARETLVALDRSTEENLPGAAEAGLLEKYRLALIEAAKRYKRYPTQAVDRGWRGRVEIRLVVGPNGSIKSTHIKRSSSYPILDDQAMDMVKKSTRSEPIPPALRGREFILDIPVIFELQAG